MGKARGPKRKEAPSRKRLQASNPSNSALLQKQSRRNRGQRVHRAAGLDGDTASGKGAPGQQLLVPNKRTRGIKRRRKSKGSTANQPVSSETAAIQAEYAAVDARASAKKASEEAQRLRAPVRIKLAPATATLRMPSEGGDTMQAQRASSSARMVEALLESIADDPMPGAPPARPVRSASRKRKGNPFAALQGDSSDDDGSDDGSSDGQAQSDDGAPTATCSSGDKKSGQEGGVFGGSANSVAALTFAAPSGFGSSGRRVTGVGGLGWGVTDKKTLDDDDPDL